MENTHDVQYLVQTNDGRFMAANTFVGKYTQYPNHAEIFTSYDTAKHAASCINEFHREGVPIRARVILREIYINYDESIDQFPKVK